MKVPCEVRQHELVTFVYDNFRYAWVFEANGDTCTLPKKPVLTISSAAAQTIGAFWFSTSKHGIVDLNVDEV